MYFTLQNPDIIMFSILHNFMCWPPFKNITSLHLVIKLHLLRILCGFIVVVDDINEKMTFLVKTVNYGTISKLYTNKMGYYIYKVLSDTVTVK